MGGMSMSVKTRRVTDRGIEINDKAKISVYFMENKWKQVKIAQVGDKLVIETKHIIIWIFGTELGEVLRCSANF